MKMISRIAASLAGAFIVSACHGRPAEIPTQVIYRYDDHRYLELKGFYCQGALWYTDTKRGIKTEIFDQFYQAFSQIYIHPSERYMVVTNWDDYGDGTVSKDYGKTWQPVSMSGGRQPNNREFHSLTVVDDRAYWLAKDGRLYTSSAPFDDPRAMKGGTGIDYIIDGEKVHLDAGHITNGWGLQFIQNTHLINSTSGFLSNWQDAPQKVPKVKNYQGWDHMKCNPDLGLTAK
ncbi:hypothetical protein CWS43_12115 [Rahnella sp. AA]|uniref:T6SS immunity protein Tli3 family protein n=1 Tax=Rahnella sp. AA TaxID=2057180 RepID=UPI000C329AF6|nr:hypothetical protein [Rahnella sp. AA]PKE30364.1 hypothetical protein CWS43_12115 [Rahnella sp. AA]